MLNIATTEVHAMRPLHAIAFDPRLKAAQAGDDGLAGFVGGMLVVVSNGLGWDHVSASLKDRCPTWEEMSLIRDICFEPDECVMQLHVPVTEHINHHPYCLHLWRPQKAEIPRPPGWMVGPVC